MFLSAILGLVLYLAASRRDQAPAELLAPVQREAAHVEPALSEVE